MHEITLCQQAIELIERHARQHGAIRIVAVWLDVGAFSCVEISALEFCFEMVCRGTLAEGCELHLDTLNAECWCHDCQKNVALLTHRVRICPHCDGCNLRIVAEDGVMIKRIEIEGE